MLSQLSQKVTRFFNPNQGLTAPEIDYSVPPSFAAKLPWCEVDKNGVTELEDGQSVGAFFAITPVSTEDKHQLGLNTILSNLTNTFVTVGKKADEDNPWIIQLFARDIDDLSNLMPRLQEKVRIDDAFSQAVLNEDAKHFALIGREQGIFSSKNRAWRGRSRQVFMAVYRWLPTNTGKSEVIKNRKQLASLQRYLLNPSSMSDHGVGICRASGKEVFNWLAPFLNPASHREELSHRERFSIIDRDYSERLLQSHVTADVENGLWWFKNTQNERVATRVVELDSWSSESFLTGRIFGEVGDDSQQDADKQVLFDDLPPGSMFTMTLVPQSTQAGRERIAEIKKSAVGGEAETVACREQCDEMDKQLNKNALWRGQIAIYLQGKSVEEIESHTEVLRSIFDTKGLGAKFVDNSTQIAPLDAFFRWLPMNYQPQFDSKYWYCGFVWLEDMLRLSPLFGRSVGTGADTLTFFNRGGEPLSFDPLTDFRSNAHLNLFGPSGSGKSATLVGICLRLLAIHRPRLFIIEAGDSFGLLADYCRKHGLTVNKVSLKPGCNTSLAPFSDAKHLAGVDVPHVTSDAALLPERLNDNDDDSEERDILGELEIMARMMITGGEQREIDDYRRADSSMVRQALVNAANTCQANNVMVRPTHVREALLAFSTEDTYPPERQQRARMMSDSMAFFCEGMEGKIFNGEGEAWPEADVTIIDLGIYAKNGYEAQMATAYISLINRINGIAERDQYKGVPIVCLTDEAHLISTNLLLAPYATKIVKMWRKLSAWFWLATQDLADFPSVSRKMLNNAEWWVLLNMSEDELNTLQDFKKLSDNKLDLIRSMTSEKHKFKEGVVMGMDDSLLARFTIIPPALYLALGETDGEAKKKRKDFMDEHGCTALEAALLKAQSIEDSRVHYQGEGW